MFVFTFKLCVKRDIAFSSFVDQNFAKLLNHKDAQFIKSFEINGCGDAHCRG